jgi:hypothetical protein
MQDPVGSHWPQVIHARATTGAFYTAVILKSSYQPIPTSPAAHPPRKLYTLTCPKDMKLAMKKAPATGQLHSVPVCANYGTLLILVQTPFNLRKILRSSTR